MGLSRTVSEIDGDFSRKLLKKFPTPYFCAPAVGASLGIGYRRWGQKTRMMGLPGRQRNFTTSSAVLIQCTNVTDRRTPGHSKDRVYALRRAVTMNRCGHLYTNIPYSKRLRWSGIVLTHLPPQILSEFNSENILKIVPRLPKLS